MTRTPRRAKSKPLPPISPFEEGRLSWIGSPFPKPCLVLAFSDEGAEIRLLGEVSLPQVVELSVPGKHLTVRSQVLKHQGVIVGLRFVDR